MADDVSWKNALKRAALPGAARVVFEKRVNPKENAVSYTLKSFTADGAPIGDDRDYDLLKAVMTPLERLAEDYDDRLMVSLDVEADVVVVDAG